MLDIIIIALLSFVIMVVMYINYDVLRLRNKVNKLLNIKTKKEKLTKEEECKHLRIQEEMEQELEEIYKE